MTPSPSPPLSFIWHWAAVRLQLDSFSRTKSSRRRANFPPSACFGSGNYLQPTSVAETYANWHLTNLSDRPSKDPQDYAFATKLNTMSLPTIYPSDEFNSIQSWPAMPPQPHFRTLCKQCAEIAIADDRIGYEPYVLSDEKRTWDSDCFGC